MSYIPYWPLSVSPSINVFPSSLLWPTGSNNEAMEFNQRWMIWLSTTLLHNLSLLRAQLKLRGLYLSKIALQGQRCCLMTLLSGCRPMQVLDVVLSIMVPILCKGMTCNRAPDSRLRSPSTFKWNRKYGITRANHASGAPNLSSTCGLTLPIHFNSWLVKHTRAFPSKIARDACRIVP